MCLIEFYLRKKVTNIEEYCEYSEKLKFLMDTEQINIKLV